MYYESELYHHGIKGQKWGVRRFQNEDGSLTSKGKSRYGKGREVFKEHSKITNEQLKKLQDRSKEYKQVSEEYDRVTDKFDLDNRWNHDDDSGYDKMQRNFAEGHREYLARKIDDMNEAFYDKATKYADKQIMEKYGDVGMSDMKHFQQVNAGIAFLTAGAGVAVMMAIAHKK